MDTFVRNRPADREPLLSRGRVTGYRALVVSGVLWGLERTHLSIGHHTSFIRDMSVGKG